MFSLASLSQQAHKNSFEKIILVFLIIKYIKTVAVLEMGKKEKNRDLIQR